MCRISRQGNGNEGLTGNKSLLWRRKQIKGENLKGRNEKEESEKRGKRATKRQNEGCLIMDWAVVTQMI